MGKKLKYKGLLKPKKKSISQSNEYSPGSEKSSKETVDAESYKKSKALSHKTAKHKQRHKQKQEEQAKWEAEHAEEKLDLLEKGEAMFEGPELPAWHDLSKTAEVEGKATTSNFKEPAHEVELAEGEAAAMKSEGKSKAKMAAKYGGKMCAGCGGKMHEGGNIMKHDHPHGDLPYTQEEFDKLDPRHKEKLSAGFPGMYKIGADTPTKEQLDKYRKPKKTSDPLTAGPKYSGGGHFGLGKLKKRK